jgi:FecR protein
MFCNKCGAQLAEGHVFCANCGARAGTPQTQSPSRMPSTATAQESNQPGARQPGAPRTSRNSVIIGGIAALVFACGLGAYLGVNASHRSAAPTSAGAAASGTGQQTSATPLASDGSEFSATPGPTPKQAAYLSLVSGDVGYQRGDDDQAEWTAASLNTPLVIGDSLYATTKDSKAEVQTGDGNVVRIGDQATVSILQNSDDIFQLKLTGGIATVRARQLGRAYEIDTPSLAFLPQEPGEYRFDVDAQGNTTVTASLGKGLIDTQQGQRLLIAPASMQVALGAAPVASTGAAAEPAYDQWNQQRDNLADQSASQQKLPPEVPGADALDLGGRWVDTEYGAAWVPNGVTADWQPYQVGRWIWEPYGWTWVSSEPWGWAPYHYGSWTFVTGEGWVWLPGSTMMRPVFAPARVEFVASGASFGWFPLGPHEVYVSMYDVGFAPRPVIEFVNYRRVIVIDRADIRSEHYRYERADYHVFERERIIGGVPRDITVDRRVMFPHEEGMAARGGERRFAPPVEVAARRIVNVHPIQPARSLNGTERPPTRTVQLPNRMVAQNPAPSSRSNGSPNNSQQGKQGQTNAAPNGNESRTPQQTNQPPSGAGPNGRTSNPPPAGPSGGTPQGNPSSCANAQGGGNGCNGGAPTRGTNGPQGGNHNPPTQLGPAPSPTSTEKKLPPCPKAQPGKPAPAPPKGGCSGL